MVQCRIDDMCDRIQVIHTIGSRSSSAGCTSIIIRITSIIRIIRITRRRQCCGGHGMNG